MYNGLGEMAKLANAADSKSAAHSGLAGSNPALATQMKEVILGIAIAIFFILAFELMIRY